MVEGEEILAPTGALARQLQAPSESLMRILVVDDEVDVADSLAEVLRLELGCRVDVVHDGESAWTRVLESTPDALILDLRMPGTGGLDIANRLRAGATGGPLPLLVAITGYDAADVVADLSDSFHHAFSKPVDIAALVRALREHWRGEDPRGARSRFELSSLVARTVGEAMPMLRGAGIDVGFDYDGPFVVLDEDDAALQAALYRLLCGVHDLVAAGSMQCQASARTLPGGNCRLVVQLPAAGRPGARDFGDVAARLRLAEAPGATGLPDGTRQATGRCPVTGGRVTLLEVPGEGVLFRYEQVWRPVEAVDVPDGLAAGRRAWLVGAAAAEGALFARRLVRLGWRVARFESAQAMAAALRETPARPGPELVFRFDDPNAGVDPRTPASCLEADAPACVRVVVAGPSAPVPAFGDGGGERRFAPVAPAELLALTRRLAATPLADEARLDDACTLSMDLDAALSVLVVDDIEVNRMVAAGLLAMLGCRTDEAPDGLGAIDSCRRSPPDVVLMDVNMPILGGIEATRHIRELQRLGRLPPFAIVAATANSDAETARQCRDAGMDAVLVKPLDAKLLKRTLDGLALRSGR